TIHVATSPYTFHRSAVSRFTSESFQFMSTFDPTTVRKSVEEFTPRRPPKFQDLLPAKDVIVELRQKRASYRSIADLLTQHCLPTSKTAIAMFCHQVLGENVRPRKRPGRRKPVVPSVSTDETTHHPVTDANLTVERPQIQTAMKHSRRALAARASPRCECSNPKAHETSRPHPQ